MIIKTEEKNGNNITEYSKHGGRVIVTMPKKLTDNEITERKRIYDLDKKNTETELFNKIKSMTSNEKIEFLLELVVDNYKQD